MENALVHSHPPSVTWSPAPPDLGLTAHQVDIWRVCLDLSTDLLLALSANLSTDELRRAERFHFQADKTHFIAAHGCLRYILTRYLPLEPHQLRFSANAYGKPCLSPERGLDFNLSHSKDIALIAITLNRRVGVDIEHIRADIATEEIARRFFSEGEVSELLALPVEQRETAFFNCWTRKEAYIKAQGLGLSLPLESFDVSLAPNEPASLHATRPDLQEAARWTLKHLTVDPGYVAAIAVEGKDPQFRLWEWNTKY